MTDLPDELAGLAPEQVLAFLREASDETLLERVRAIGTATVLGLVFDGWATQVPSRPGRAPGVLLFALDDDGSTHRYALQLDALGAQHVAGTGVSARSTVRTSVLRFLRVAAGAQDPKRLVLTGRMRIGGDALWAVTTLSGMRRE